MRKIFALLVLPLMLTACVAGLDEELNYAKLPATLYADLTAGFDKESRTYISQGNYLHWHQGDLLSVFYGNTLNSQYKFNGETGDNSGTFSVVPSNDLGTGNSVESIYAVYPYSSETKLQDDCTLLLNIPASQTYAEDSFGKEANVMVAVTNGLQDNFLAFKNVGGYLKLSLYGEVEVQSIMLQGNNGEKISGNAIVTAGFDESPTLTMFEEASDIITLNCGTGVTLGQTAYNAIDFWFVLPPTTFEQGFSITVTDTNGFVCSKQTNKSIVIERNKIQPMEALEIIIEAPENNEIWYTSTDGNTVAPYGGTDSKPLDIFATFGANIVSNTYKDGKGIITFDGPVTSIGDNAFYTQSTLSSITLPEGVTYIGNNALRRTYLTSANIPHKVTSIGTFAFSETNIKNITIPESVTEINTSAFCYTDIENFYGKFTTTDHKCVIVDDTLICLAPMVKGEYVLPEGIRVLGKGSLTSFNNDIAITIPQSVEEIESMAVTGSWNITAFRGKYASLDNLSLIKDGTLYGVAANNLKYYHIPEGIKTIETLLFQSCGGLRSVTLPESVETIKSMAFDNCDGLKFIHVKSTNPPMTSSNLFNDTNNSTGVNGLPYIYVPAEAIDAYKSAAGWKYFVDNINPYDEKLFTITYTSNDGNIVVPYSGERLNGLTTKDIFGADIISHTYKNGVGKIVFDGIVSHVGNYAFHECKNLESFTVPGGVIELGYGAFYNSGLKEIEIPKHVTTLGTGVFNNCDNLESIVIPTSIRTLPKHLCKDCDNLKSITLHDGITSIGISAFNNCPNLTECIMPKSLTTISESAFYGCTGLTELTFHNSLKTIGKTAFRNCSGIQKLTFGTGLQSVKAGAFRDCSGMTGVYISNLSKWSKIDFEDYYANPTAMAYRLFLNDTEIIDLVVPEDITVIKPYAYRSLRYIKSITLHNNITSIGTFAFGLCDSVESITIPESVTTIEEAAFYRWNAAKAFYGKFTTEDNRAIIVDNKLIAIAPVDLDNYDIPEGVTTIGREAFKRIQYIRNVTIPSTVTHIDSQAFNDCGTSMRAVYCKALTPPVLDGTAVFDLTDCGIYVAAEVLDDYKRAAGWSEYASRIYAYTDDYTTLTYTSITGDVITPNVENGGFGANIISNTYSNGVGRIVCDGIISRIPDRAFYEQTALKNISLPKSVLGIGAYAFYGCSSLTEISLPEEITNIAAHAFSLCSKISSVVIPNKVKTLGNCVFETCEALANVTLGNSVSSIGNWAFHSTNIKEITLPESLTSVGYAAFATCKQLEYFYGKGASADNRCLVIDGTLVHMSSHVSGDYVLPDNVKHIGKNSISYVQNVITLTLPESVESCDERPTIGTNIKAFYGKFATADNRALIKDDILLAVALYDLTEYSVPEGISKIREYTFSYVYGLHTITLPSTITTIDYNAFLRCYNLTTLYCKAVTPPTLGDGAFDEISNLTTIYVPIGSINAYKEADGWKEFADKMDSYTFGVGDFESEGGNYN